MKLLHAMIAAAAACTSPGQAAFRDCGGVIDGSQVRVAPRVPDPALMPVHDWIPLGEAQTTVTCRIRKSGRLDACTSPLTDERGRWLEREYDAHSRVIDQQWHGCPLAGQSIRFKYRFVNPSN